MFYVRTYTKKRGSLYLLLIPLIEAFALPKSRRMSNANTHADMKYVQPHRQPKVTSMWKEVQIYHTHGHLPLLLFSRGFGKLRSFYEPRTKRQVNAFLLYIGTHRTCLSAESPKECRNTPIGAGSGAKIHIIYEIHLNLQQNIAKTCKLFNVRMCSSSSTRETENPSDA